MTVTNLDVNNIPKETTVTNMELDKKGEPKVTTQEVAIGLGVKEELKGTIEPGKAPEGDHDGRDGDPELVNFLLDDKDKYIKVEIRADIVDGKPVIKEDGKHLIWAKFLRPTWKLDNLINSKKFTITPEGNFTAASKFNEEIVKYLLREWNLPLQIVFGLDLDGNEIISNFDVLVGTSGVHLVILTAMLDLVKLRI